MQDDDAIKEHGSKTAYGKVHNYVQHHLVDNVGADKLHLLYKMYTWMKKTQPVQHRYYVTD